MIDRLCPAPQQWFSYDRIDLVNLVCFNGLPQEPKELGGMWWPQRALAFRATPYATVHGATWAQRMSACSLCSFACLPGRRKLGLIPLIRLYIFGLIVVKV
jgi:hypothetical protein